MLEFWIPFLLAAYITGVILSLFFNIMFYAVENDISSDWNYDDVRKYARNALLAPLWPIRIFRHLRPAVPVVVEFFQYALDSKPKNRYTANNNLRKRDEPVSDAERRAAARARVRADKKRGAETPQWIEDLAKGKQ